MGHGTLPPCESLECCPSFFSSVRLSSWLLGYGGVQVDKNLKNRPLQVESLQELELERLLGLCVSDSSPLPVGRYLLGNISV